MMTTPRRFRFRFLALALALAITAGGVLGASFEKEQQVKTILTQMEADCLAFRDEIEAAYSQRCSTDTLNQCARGNYNDCASTFPNQICMDPSELVIQQCGDGRSCNALWDKSITTVAFPAALAQGEGNNPTDSELVETVCYTRHAEDYMVQKYEDDAAFWAQFGTSPSWSYFGAHNGMFRQVPATLANVCGKYDPRLRPWYVAASSGPKDVVIVIDTSGSMDEYGRMRLAIEAATTIVNMLTVADRVAIVPFSDSARILGGDGATLIRATNENKKKIVNAIKGLSANGSTNFYEAFARTFDALDTTIRQESTTGCNIAVLFLTDGQITEGPGSDAVISLVNGQAANLSTRYGRKTVVFTFSLGLNADTTTTKQIACATGGIFTQVDDYALGGDLVTTMSSYFKLFALGLGEGDNDDFTAWVEPCKCTCWGFCLCHRRKVSCHSNDFFILVPLLGPLPFLILPDQFFTEGKPGTTVSAPVYDRTVDPPLFLGVVGIDFLMTALEEVLGESATSSTMLDRFVLLSTAQCPAINLTECQLDALRYLGGGEEATCGRCSSGSSSGYHGIVPTECRGVSDLPRNLWDNNDMEGKEYHERACCEIGKAVPSDQCTGPRGFGAAGNLSTGAIIGIAIGIIILGLGVCCCCYFSQGKKSREKFSAASSTNAVPNGENNRMPRPHQEPDIPVATATSIVKDSGTGYDGVKVVMPPPANPGFIQN